MTAPSRSEDMSWLPTSETPLTDAAMAYAAHGFQVIAVWWVKLDAEGKIIGCGCRQVDCPRKTWGKHPIGAAWQKSSLVDADAVRDARRKYPHANVGLAMGGQLRLVAVDIDGPAGRASLAALEEEHGQLPPTLTSKSGRLDGGEHRIFAVPAHLDIKKIGNRSSWAADGIDTKIDNGQIVAAPSAHESGNRYEWSVRDPIAEIPGWLFDALTKQAAPPAREPSPIPAAAPRSETVTASVKKYVEKVLQNACDAIARQKEGGRNQLLFAKASTVFEYAIGEGLDHVRLWQELAASAAHCGLPQREIEVTLNKAWTRAPDHPRRVPALKVAEYSAPPAPPAPASSPSSPDVSGLGSEDQSWKKHLDGDGKGYLKKTLANVTTILTLDPRWAGVIAYDAFGECEVTTRVPPVRPQDAPKDARPGDWTDQDSTRTANWLSTEYALDVGDGLIDKAVSVVAHRQVIHPVRDYLSTLKWDGVPRLDTMLSTYFRAHDTAYVRGVSSRWMISAVARAFEPGCQADCALVLESPMHGKGKSTGLEVLASRAWFGDTALNIGDKDSYQALRRKWIYELGELGSIRRDINRTKSFLSARVDNYRASFGRRNRDYPRQCVFAGTTNESSYLIDRTGNRRFWPVRVDEVDRPALGRDRDQLWAEARVRYEQGEKWHVDTAEFRALCEDEQADRVQDEPWEQLVSAWLEAPWFLANDPRDGQPIRTQVDLKKGILTSEVLAGAIGMRSADWGNADEQRVAAVLRSLGYERGPRSTENGSRVRRYVKADQVKSPDHPGPNPGPLSKPSRSLSNNTYGPGGLGNRGTGNSGEGGRAELFSGDVMGVTFDADHPDHSTLGSDRSLGKTAETSMDRVDRHFGEMTQSVVAVPDESSGDVDEAAEGEFFRFDDL